MKCILFIYIILYYILHYVILLYILYYVMLYYIMLCYNYIIIYIDKEIPWNSHAVMLTPEDTQDFDASDHSHCLKIRLWWIWCCHCTRATDVRLTEIEISLESYSLKPGDHVSIGMVQWSKCPERSLGLLKQDIPLLPVCCWCHHLSYENCSFF